MTTPKQDYRALRVKVAHCSMRFGISEAKKIKDFDTLFSRGYYWITGTEAGPGAGNSQKIMKAAARKWGYYLVVSSKYGTWVAVRKTLTTSAGVRKTESHALDNSTKLKTPGKFGAKGVVGATFNTGKIYGKISVGAVHYTNTSGSGGKTKKKLFDTKYAKVLVAWRKRRVKYGSLVFMGGDMNRNDRTNDVFMGQGGFITCWDERDGAYPHTSEGNHGTIDVIARMTGTSRVKLVSCRHWNDNGIFMNTDHYIIEAVYDIMPIGYRSKK